MGNRFEFTVVAPQLHLAEEAVNAAIAEVSRIEELLSTYKESSQTNLINRYAGISPVEVDGEVVRLILRAQKISDLTQGAFDLSYGSIDTSLWNFDVNMKALPDRQQALRSVSLINYRNIIVNVRDSTVMLKEKGMRIGFGGIGKGYAADCARAILQSKGIESGIVNAAGDLITWGSQANGLPWTIGIADPGRQSRPFSALNISNAAIATSGDYEKYAMIDGKRYAHTIDPKTGLPVSGIQSASIICSSAELADALATPVMVMGLKIGLNLINQLQQVACVIIDDKGCLHTSKNMKINY